MTWRPIQRTHAKWSTTWATGARNFLSDVFDTDIGDVKLIVLFVKLTFEMLTVHGQQHFLSDEWIFLRNSRN